MKKAATYLLLCACLLVVGTGYVFAQTDSIIVPQNEQLAKADTTHSDTLEYLKAEPRGVDQATIDKYKKDDDYHYDYTPPPEDSQSFWDWLRSLFRRNTETPDVDPGNLFDIISYLIIAFAVAMIIYIIVSGNFTGIVRGTAKKTGVEYTVNDIDINAIDFDALIAEALGLKDYRKVVRLYYLQTLKALSDKNLIEFQPDKTNADYMRELKKSDLKPVFARLTYVYEYVWYGQFEIDENNFSAASKAFNDFKTTLKR